MFSYDADYMVLFLAAVYYFLFGSSFQVIAQDVLYTIVAHVVSTEL